MGEVKQMQTPANKYASMSRDELMLAKADVEGRLLTLKAKHKTLDTKPYQLRTGQDRVTLQRLELELAKLRAEVTTIAAAFTAIKERRRAESEAEPPAVKAAFAAPGEAKRLREELDAANAKLSALRGAEHAIEFMAVARLVLAESTWGRIKTRADDNLRARRKAAERG